MKLKKLLLPAAISWFLLGAGCSLFQTVNVNTAANTNVSATDNTSLTTLITYNGEDGKNALELLQAQHTIDVSAEGFVNSINGVEPVGNQFWAFYVNGEQAQVGAKDYQTKSSDTIEWKLESF
jgi:hypothetical protein